MAGTAVAIIAATITVVARPNSNFFLNFPLPFLLRSTEDRLQRFELYPNIGFSEGPHHCQLSQPLASLEVEGADDEPPLVLIAATIEPTSRPKKMRLTSSFTRISPTLLKESGDTFTYPCHALKIKRAQADAGHLLDPYL